MAHSLVVSNLMGHDSHGMLRVTSYLEAIEQGGCDPAARPSITRETPSTALVDGNWAFGMVTAHYATQVAIEKARTAQVAAVAMTRCNHIGRLGEYTEQAAREGMVAFMVSSAFNDAKVTPYGGAGRMMGTNPIAFGVPTSKDEPIVCDMATSVAAEGKLRVAVAKHQPIAEGIIVDKEGNPTTNAEDFYAGGMLLPFGCHKGYGLSVVADLLGRHLAGAEEFAGDGKISFGNLIIVLNANSFRPLAEFQQVAGERLGEIKGVKTAPGFTEIMLPGEPERHTLARRTEEGINLPEETMKKLAALAVRYGVSMPEVAAV